MTVTATRFTPPDCSASFDPSYICEVNAPTNQKTRDDDQQLLLHPC
jgi:hypothetical protein